MTVDTPQAGTTFGGVSGATWIPSDETARSSRLWKLMTALNASSVDDLHRLALRDPARYWDAVVAELGIHFAKPYDQVLDLSLGKPFPRWFSGGLMNLADTCVVARGTGDGANRVAIETVDENGRRSIMTYAELLTEVRACAAYLTRRGVGHGDCVILFLPLTPEATVAFFACAWVGAIAVPTFTGYGAGALVARLADSGATAIFTAREQQRKGQRSEMASVVVDALEQAPGVHTVVCVGDELPADDDRWATWDTAVRAGAGREPGTPAQMDPNDPVMLIYTSGTTGQPKGILQTHAGYLLKAASDFAVAFDLRRDDRLLWLTDIGWLVGTMVMVGSAAVGSTAIYYIGAPDYPDGDQIWRVAAALDVSVLGLSPSAVRRSASIGSAHPAEDFGLDSLRAFLSTGEPWDSDSWYWLFDRVGRSARPILNYTGGTEIGGGILTCYAALPVRACCFTGPVIGVDAAVVNEAGSSVVGEVGELVINNVSPGMTSGFWKDASGERYLDAYWSRLPEVWVHGDLAERDPDGWWAVSGRSDDTMKISGRRIGPGEIESALITHDQVVDVAVIGVPDPIKGQTIVAFVVPAAGAPPESAALIAHVISLLGKSYAPSRVELVTALPRTRSGKLMRRAVKARYTGMELGDLSALESHASLLAIPVLP